MSRKQKSEKRPVARTNTKKPKQKGKNKEKRPEAFTFGGVRKQSRYRVRPDNWNTAERQAAASERVRKKLISKEIVVDGGNKREHYEAAGLIIRNKNNKEN